MTHSVGQVLLKEIALTGVDLLSAVQRRGPLEYGNYRNLTPGDYKYQDAYLNISLHAPAGAGRPAIGDCVLSVDLADISEQITGTVSAGWTVIPLTKGFSVPPEVVVYQRNGTVHANGVTQNITTTQFEAALIGATGFISGDIAAIASGY